MPNTSKFLLLILLSFLGNTQLHAQHFFPDAGMVFSDEDIPAVYISIDKDSLDQIYADVKSDHEYPATFVFKRAGFVDTVYHVGFRLRGNTSRFAQKKSFKVSFNTFEKGRKWQKLEKLNLNGEHNDPSIIRSKLYWDLCRKMGVPAPRANHVELYINGAYYGLYINVEHIDEEFVKSRFGNQDGNLYKCLYPADLKYISDNPNAYKTEANDHRIYDLKTNTSADDYSNLSNFIKVLTKTPLDDLPCVLPAYIDIQSFLKVAAIDIFTANWDDYIFNKNNFYLYYNTAEQRFEFIPYDTDNTFGITWSPVDWKSRNMYQWSGEFRPLYDRLMMVPQFKNQFSYYFSQLLVLADTTVYFKHIDSIRQLIAGSVKNDSWHSKDYGYSYSDFVKSYTSGLGAHVPEGLKPYISGRIKNGNQQIVLKDVSPWADMQESQPGGPDSPVIFSVRAFDDSSNMKVYVHYQLGNSSWDSLLMNDQGMNGDSKANDSKYTAMLPAPMQETRIRYFYKMIDISGNYSRYPCTNLEFMLRYSGNYALFINELMASNSHSFVDNYGEYDDWFELYNAGSTSVWLGNKYMSDDPGNPDKFALPEYYIMPGEYLVFWADNDTEQGKFHCNFKLSKSGEFLGVFDEASTGYAVIDSLYFDALPEDVSYGRKTDGGSEWKLFDQATPGWSNSLSSIADEKGRKEIKYIKNGQIILFEENVNAVLYDFNGKMIFSSLKTQIIDLNPLPKGFYIMFVNGKSAQKIANF